MHLAGAGGDVLRCQAFASLERRERHSEALKVNFVAGVRFFALALQLSFAPAHHDRHVIAMAADPGWHQEELHHRSTRHTPHTRITTRLHGKTAQITTQKPHQT